MTEAAVGMDAEEKPRLRVLELYAGIGGMHFALNRCFKFSEVAKSEIPFSSFEVVAAVDVNEVAASVYRHNFPSVKYLGSGVERFTVAELEALRFDMVTMSPPCQPFTRQGRKLDEEDARTKSLFHFLSLLKAMSSRGTAPEFIVVENVYGFETSATRKKLVDTIGDSGYKWREFLLTPTQFGIPNSRLRYFLIGKRGDFDEALSSPTCSDLYPDTVPFFLTNLPYTLLKEVPIEVEAFRHHKSINKNLSEPAQKQSKSGVTAEDLDSISTFLDTIDSDHDKNLLVPDKLLKRFMVMDITFPDSKRSCCFTKAYGKCHNCRIIKWLLRICGFSVDCLWFPLSHSLQDTTSTELGHFSKQINQVRREIRSMRESSKLNLKIPVKLRKRRINPPRRKRKSSSNWTP